MLNLSTGMMWLQSFIKHGTIPMENNFYLRTYAEHLVSPEQQRIEVFFFFFKTVK